MKAEITICDLCGKELNKVNTEGLSGRGKLFFKYSVGGYGGGTGDTIDMPDLCVLCSESLRENIDDWRRNIKPKIMSETRCRNKSCQYYNQNMEFNCEHGDKEQLCYIGKEFEE